MKARLFFLILFFLFFTQNIRAQFPEDVQYQTIVSAIPAMPDYLNTVEDTSVPDAMTIKRITEYIAEWDWYPTHSYSKIQPWNADGTFYKIRALAVYDAITHQELKNLPGGEIYPVYWSNTDPNLMYSFKEDGVIKTYSVDTEVQETIYTLQGYDIVKLGPGEGNIDKNDHYVALIGKRGVDMDVIVYDLQTNQVIHTEIYAGAWGNGASVPDYVDWVSVSQSGDYVGIMWNHNTTSQANPFNSHYGVEIYNTTDMQYLRRIARYGNHGDFGYAINGEEVFVQFWGPTGTLNMFYLDRLERVVLSTHADFNSSGHISCRNMTRPGYAYVSQDRQDHSGQIVAFKLDDSGLVEHFGHHYNSYSNFAAIPVPNPNGDTVMFKSDFSNAQNNQEVYVFEVKKSNVTASIEDENNSFISIYPNPVTDFINIKSDKNISEINIYNSIGQLVMRVANKNNEITTIDVTTLNNGLYTLQAVCNTKLISRKIIIQ